MKRQSRWIARLAGPFIIAYYVLPLVIAVASFNILGGGVAGWAMLGVGLAWPVLNIALAAIQGVD